MENGDTIHRQIEQIRCFFDELSQRGLSRPSGMSAEQFVQRLSEYGLFSASSCAVWVASYHLLRYQGQHPTEDQWSQAQSAMKQAFVLLEALSAEQRNALEQALSPRLCATQTNVVRDSASLNNAEDTGVIASLIPSKDTDVAAPFHRVEAADVTEVAKKSAAADVTEVAKRAAAADVKRSSVRSESVGGSGDVSRDASFRISKSSSGAADSPLIRFVGRWLEGPLFWIVSVFLGVLGGVGVLGFVLGFAYGAPVVDDLRAVGRWLGILGKPVCVVTPAQQKAQARQRLRAQGQRLRQALQRNPLSDRAWTEMADFATQRRRYGDAVLFYRRAISLNPKNAIALNNLAWLHLMTQDHLFHAPHEALVLAKRAYRLNPQPFVLDTLAEATYQRGQAAQAIVLQKEALKKARLLHKRYPKAVQDLAHFENQLKKFQNALVYHQRRKAKRELFLRMKREKQRLVAAANRPISRPIQATSRPIQATNRPIQATSRPIQAASRPIQMSVKPPPRRVAAPCSSQSLRENPRQLRTDCVMLGAAHT